MTTTLFYTDASDFIYQKNIGLVFDIADQLFRANCVRLEECVAVYEYTQDDASLSGYEWQWFLPPVGVFNGDMQMELFADYVRGKLDTGEDLPRMPPRRQGIGLQWESNQWMGNIRYSFVSGQNNTGENETATDSYVQFNADLSYRYENAEGEEIFVFLQMKNLLDEEIRKSTSFLRNFTPEPGREVSLGIRYRF